MIVFCENCNKKHDGTYGSGRFCSDKCARSFSTKKKRKQINRKVSNTLKRKNPKNRLSKFKIIKNIMSKCNIPIKHRKVGGLKSATLRKNKISNDLENLSWDQVIEKYGKKVWKRRILKEQKNKCSNCGISEWMDKPLVLELEHKDGDTTNNKRYNLECLCPNCHSQTKYFRGRNKTQKKKKNVSDEKLLKVLRKEKNIRQALIRVGLSPYGGNYKRAIHLLETTY